MRLRTRLCLEANYDSEVEPWAMFEAESDSKLESEFYYDAEEEVHPEEEVQAESSTACTFECVCEAEHESETEPMNEQVPLPSHSVPATSGYLKAAAQSLHTGPAIPSSHHSTFASQQSRPHHWPKFSMLSKKRNMQQGRGLLATVISKESGGLVASQARHCVMH